LPEARGRRKDQDEDQDKDQKMSKQTKGRQLNATAPG
jgi:hypothetical protein